MSADQLNVDTSLEGNQGDTSGNPMVAPQTDLLEGGDPFSSLHLPQVGKDDFDQILGSAQSPVSFSSDFRAVPAVPASSRRMEALNFAKQFVGKTPYVWGGTTPQGFDCSGLVQYVWKKFGMSLPRVSSQQAFAGQHKALSQLKPMDLVIFTQNGDGHVAFWLGNGRILEAAHTGTNVRIRKLGRGESVFGVSLNVN